MGMGGVFASSVYVHVPLIFNAVAGLDRKGYDMSLDLNF